MDKRFFAYILIALGCSLIFLGVLFLFSKRLLFFGRLPGDIRIEKENYSLFIPITSMLIISLVLTVIINIISKILK